MVESSSRHSGRMLYDGLQEFRGGVVLAVPGTTHYVKPDGLDTNSGSSWGSAFKTVQKAIDAAVAGDRILVAPGFYDQALVVNKAKLVIEGVGGIGSVGMAPSAANGIGILIDGVSDVTLRNFGGEGKGTGGGLHVKGSAKTRRFRAVDGKYEGGAFAARIESTGADPLTVGDTRLEYCELTWATTALHLKVSGAGDPVTETLVRGCYLHDFSGRGVHVDTVHAPNLWLLDNWFQRQQNGDEPANEYVLAAVASTTGVLQGNRFPAAKATGKISVAAGVIKSGNWYSDGVEGQA